MAALDGPGRGGVGGRLEDEHAGEDPEDGVRRGVERREPAAEQVAEEAEPAQKRGVLVPWLLTCAWVR